MRDFKICNHSNPTLRNIFLTSRCQHLESLYRIILSKFITGIVQIALGAARMWSSARCATTVWICAVLRIEEVWEEHLQRVLEHRQASANDSGIGFNHAPNSCGNWSTCVYQFVVWEEEGLLGRERTGRITVGGGTDKCSGSDNGGYADTVQYSKCQCESENLEG